MGITLQPCGIIFDRFANYDGMDGMDGIEIWHYIPHRIKNRTKAGQGQGSVTVALKAYAATGNL
jgi:hypothetical protein